MLIIGILRYSSLKQFSPEAEPRAWARVGTWLILEMTQPNTTKYGNNSRASFKRTSDRTIPNMSGDGSSLRSSFSTFPPNEELAVIISLGKANDKGHTSVVYCLEVVGDLQNREFRILGKPFRLYNQHGRYIWCNQQLREERLTVGSIISYMLTSKSSKYCGNTAVEMVGFSKVFLIYFVSISCIADVSYRPMLLIDLKWLEFCIASQTDDNTFLGQNVRLVLDTDNPRSLKSSATKM